MDIDDDQEELLLDTWVKEKETQEGRSGAIGIIYRTLVSVDGTCHIPPLTDR